MGAEEEPLCSDDDVSDEENPTELFDTDNVIVCLYDKVRINYQLNVNEYMIICTESLNSYLFRICMLSTFYHRLPDRVTNGSFI